MQLACEMIIDTQITAQIPARELGEIDERRRAVDILAAIVMVMAVSRGHVEVTMVPMPVSHADANADVADLNSDAFRDDHWFVAGVQRAGKCRHR
jgi:hypothetical protein